MGAALGSSMNCRLRYHLGEERRGEKGRGGKRRGEEGRGEGELTND